MNAVFFLKDGSLISPVSMVFVENNMRGLVQQLFGKATPLLWLIAVTPRCKEHEVYFWQQ